MLSFCPPVTVLYYMYEVYEALKQRLLSSHQMTWYQRTERLLAMPTLGTRKPSELMAEMLEICPRGEEKSELFACLFLQRLPREIRVLLAKVDHKDPKELAEQADHYWGLHDSPATVAAVSPAVDNPDDGLVAVVRQSGLMRVSCPETPGWPPGSA
jgi:hypothetical protein